MKFKLLIIASIFYLASSMYVLSAGNNEYEITEERYKKICKWGIFNPPECKKRVIRSINKKSGEQIDEKVVSAEEREIQSELDKDCRWGIFNPPKCRGRDTRYGKEIKQSEKKLSKKVEKNIYDDNTKLSFFTGQFDIIDKEGDDKTTLMGIEHRNTNLNRNTFLGKFSPISGAFVTGKSSMYFYTGVEGQYGIGPIKILPSFTPGFYEKGSGKDLGSAIEFKSEIKIGLDLFENSNLGYSYSHISNNDWGKTNPGTDNQQINFSRKF